MFLVYYCHQITIVPSLLLSPGYHRHQFTNVISLALLPVDCSKQITDVIKCTVIILLYACSHYVKHKLYFWSMFLSDNVLESLFMLFINHVALCCVVYYCSFAVEVVVVDVYFISCLFSVLGGDTINL